MPYDMRMTLGACEGQHYRVNCLLLRPFVAPDSVCGAVRELSWPEKPWPGRETSACELSYIVQMGTQALKLAMGDIVGESQVIVRSFKNVQAIFDSQTD